MGGLLSLPRMAVFHALMFPDVGLPMDGQTHINAHFWGLGILRSSVGAPVREAGRYSGDLVN